MLQDLSWDSILDYLSQFFSWVLSSIGGTLLVVLLAFLALRLLRRFVVGFIARVVARSSRSTPEMQQKANTLADVVLSTGKLLIIIIAGMMILSSLGIDIGPLLASAGIAGVAIGLGAQSLIRDMINGFFILSEDQFGVGDTISVAAFSGVVEEISLRRTVIRAPDGSAIFIPNGQINTVINQSKGYANAIVDVVVMPGVDDALVTAAIHEAVDTIQDDEKYGEAILEPPRVLGITNIAPGGVTYRIVTKVTPLQRMVTEREVRRRVYQRFRERDIPQPTLVP